VFHPPEPDTQNCSPHKPAHQSSSSPLRAPFSSKLKVVPMPLPGGPNHHTDSMEKKQPTMSKFKTGPQKALFTTFPTTQATGKENRQPSKVYCTPSPYDPPSQHNFSIDGIHGKKQQNNRVLLDAAPLEESRPSRKSKQVEEPSIPSPDQLPPLHDDGTKPGHSYAMLIGMAILRAPNRRLTLAQIYKWISDTYSYYNAADAGWQNSIRHNLSLNKAFVKQERPKDDPGKGNYWAIEPGMEKQFFKDKQTKKSAAVSENVPVMSTTLTPSISQEITQPPYKPLAPASRELPQTSSFKPKAPSAPACTELSSDATIPLSDAFNEEEQNEESFTAPQFYPTIQSSPPPMHSSPPVAHHVEVRDDTPPPVPRFPTSSRNRSHKRNFASMDDSGYFSSLNSSALRGTRGDRLLTSEADRPRIKRGRAEEEIARLRGSSYDSPTKGRAFMLQSAFAPPSSSPIRRGLTCDSSQMLPPLTPAVKLKPPVKQPPQSVSPNTNLRMHRDRVRQLVGSPDRGLSCLEEGTPWSPAFNLEDTSFNDFGPEFDIFVDNATGLLTGQGGSPVKRSAKRPRTDRTHATNVLSDVSNKCRSITSTPMFKYISTPTLASSAFESPSKLLNLESPSKFNPPSLDLSAFEIPQEDFYGAEFLTEEVTEFSGVDILQGFQKIGAGGQGNQSASSGNTSSRPAFGRSFTSRF
jgi:forkhead transcription factor HCM1